MIYHVSHLTTLKYASEVRLARFNLRLKPAPWPGQTVSDYALSVKPAPWQIQESEGAYLVNECRISLRDPIRQLRVQSSFTVDVEPLPFYVTSAGGPPITALRDLALARSGITPTSPACYLFASPIAAPEPEITAWASGFLDDSLPVIEAGRALMEAVHTQFEFDNVATLADTSPTEAFRKKRGVCQDFAHVMIAAARAFGVPAAYVSGYLRTLPPEGAQRHLGADAMHAWVNLWCGEELGWVGFDPTNNLFADVDHIFVAMGRDYSDVAPLDGVFHGDSEQTMFFSVDVAPAG